MSDHSPRMRGYALFRVPERLMSYVLPWVVVAAVWPLAAGLHFALAFSGHSELWMAFLALGFAYLGFTTWKTWAVRRQETRNMVTVFAIAVLTWEVFAVAVRPWQRDIFLAWALGGLVLSVAWCIRHAALSGVRDVDKSASTSENGSMLDKIRAFKDARIGKVTETADELRARVHLDAPTTAKDAQGAREQLAALAGVGADQVKIVGVKGHEGQVDVVVNRPQDAVKPVTWKDRPDCRGLSIADAPIWLGGRTDGSDIEWWLCGDPDRDRPLAHTKWTGVSGSGKTETMVTAILQMRERIDVVPVVGDPAKFEQSFGDIEDMLGIAAKDEDQVKRLIQNLKRVIGYRSGLFASLTRADGGKGYKEWVPEMWTLHRIPLVFVDIEEAADVAVEMDAELDELLRKLRSIGVHICLSMQTMPHDNISRKTRAALVQSIAHGQNEEQDARYSLHHTTLEAGADPTKWRNNYPGSLYAEVTGTDKEHWPIDGRAPKRSAKDTQEARATTRELWAELDPGTYRILADGIVDEQTETAPAAVGAPLEGTVDDDFTEADLALTSEDGIDTGEPLAAPRGPEVTFAEPVTSRMTTEDARAMLLHRIGTLTNGGPAEVTFQALEDIPAEVGRSRGWVYDELERLAEIGVLRRLNPGSPRAIYETTGSVYEEVAAAV